MSETRDPREVACRAQPTPFYGSYRWNPTTRQCDFIKPAPSAPSTGTSTPGPSQLKPLPTSVRPPATPPAVYRPAPATTRAPISRVPSPTTLPARSKVPTILIALAVVGLGYWFVVRR